MPKKLHEIAGKLPWLNKYVREYSAMKSEIDKRDTIIERLKREIPKADGMLETKAYTNSKEAFYHIELLLALDEAKAQRPPLFRFIEIETINKCNGTCAFCPANRNSDTRPLLKMSDEMFEKIISQLNEAHYTGFVMFHSNNEPFLDEKIIDRVNYARGKLPNAHFTLFTNGSLLTVDKLLSVIDSLDNLTIDNYSSNDTLNEPVAKINAFLDEHEKYRQKVRIKSYNLNAVRTTRGGSAPNAGEYKADRIGCILPFCQAVIRPDGKLSLCCNDPMGQYTMGDLTKQSLMQAWHSEQYESVRNTLYNEGRCALPKCKRCNHYRSMYIKEFKSWESINSQEEV